MHCALCLPFKASPVRASLSLRLPAHSVAHSVTLSLSLSLPLSLSALSSSSFRLGIPSISYSDANQHPADLLFAYFHRPGPVLPVANIFARPKVGARFLVFFLVFNFENFYVLFKSSLLSGICVWKPLS